MVDPRPVVSDLEYDASAGRFSALLSVAGEAMEPIHMRVIGRVDDIGEDGVGLVRDIRAIYDNYGFKTEILAASIRSVSHVRESALAGADVATIPTEIFQKLMGHPLTDKGLAAFAADAKKAHVTIKT